MIKAKDATSYIADELDEILKSGKIKGKLNRSKSSISIYLTVKPGDNPPAKFIRSSNHHPTHKKLLHQKAKPWKSKNISIEFKEKRSRWNVNVRQNYEGSIKPFVIDVYEYESSLLDEQDVQNICQAIKTFALTGEFSDPLINTNKAAKFIQKSANIKPYNGILSTNVSIDKNGNHIAADSFGADYISENKHLQYNDIKKMLYESIMIEVAKAIKKYLNEYYE